MDCEPPPEPLGEAAGDREAVQIRARLVLTVRDYDSARSVAADLDMLGFRTAKVSQRGVSFEGTRELFEHVFKAPLLEGDRGFHFGREPVYPGSSWFTACARSISRPGPSISPANRPGGGSGERRRGGVPLLWVVLLSMLIPLGAALGGLARRLAAGPGGDTASLEQLRDRQLRAGRRVLLGFAGIVVVLGAVTVAVNFEVFTANPARTLFYAWLLLAMVGGMFVQVVVANHRGGRQLFAVTREQLLFPLLFSVIVFYPIWSVAGSAGDGYFAIYAAFLNGYFWETVVAGVQAPGRILDDRPLRGSAEAGCYPSQGLSSFTGSTAKSLTFRVTSVSSWVMAVAASSESG